MASPLSVKKNNYLDNPKKSDIHTPEWLAHWLYEEICKSGMKKDIILDPSIGSGALTNDFKKSGSQIIGIDILDPPTEPIADHYIQGKFEKIEDWDLSIPDLIIVNPPFNSAEGRKLYPEVFLRQIDKLFGTKIPVVMICPMGVTLNQRLKSVRWRYLRDNWAITTQIPLTIDVFKKEDESDVLFHAQILCFNTTGMPPTLWMPEEIVPLPTAKAKG